MVVEFVPEDHDRKHIPALEDELLVLRQRGATRALAHRSEIRERSAPGAIQPTIAVSNRSSAQFRGKRATSGARRAGRRTRGGVRSEEMEALGLTSTSHLLMFE